MKKGHDAGREASKKYTKRPPKRRKFWKADSIMTLKGDDEVKKCCVSCPYIKRLQRKGLKLQNPSAYDTSMVMDPPTI